MHPKRPNRPRAAAASHLLWTCAAATALAAALLAATAPRAQPPVTAPSAIVREDWRFRETLRAIGDWEEILARWQAATPADQRIAVLPVPADGATVRWPNPIPGTLLAGLDPDAAVTVRAAGDGFEVTGPDGAAPRTVAAGTQVVGLKHPGGGAKDQWYHAYERRFDAMTAFRPRAAAFALGLDAPFDFRAGPNALRLTLRSVGAATQVGVSLRQLLPDGERDRGSRTIALAASETQVVEMPFELRRPGGSLLLVTLTCGGESYLIPLFTHVEDVDAILTGVGRALADQPDAAGSSRLAALKRRAAAGPQGPEWRTLFEEASALRDRLLLRLVRFDKLLFVKRKPFISEQPYMDAHHLWNRPGGGIYQLSPVRPDGRVTPVVEGLGEGVYRDVNLHWDATRLLFSFGNGNDAWDGGQSYHIYEARLDGTGLRQLTRGPKNDCEPFYLPTGQIGFTSDRAEHFVMCGGDRHSANLHIMEADGSNPRQLSFNMFNDFNPGVMADGRILYSRWEYNERSVTSLHKLFTMNPDGTQVAPYYGNATIRPNVTMFPRQIPGSTKVMALLTAHHGQTHGPIGVIDVRRGVDGPDPLTLLTPGVPITGEKAEDSRFGWFSDPMPLSETTYLCSYTPTVQPWLERSWALYVGDRHGNLALVYRDPEISCAEPTPIAVRPAPLRRGAASAATAAEGEGRMMMLDVYRGLKAVPRGTVKALRIVEDLPRKGVHTGGVVVTAATNIYTAKRVLGTVPIRPDGSADFIVPANRNIYFEALDADGREIQRMRSVITLKPGERRTCIGCHEPRTSTPHNARSLTGFGAPDKITPPEWGDRAFSFPRDVQPILNSKCVGCHTHDRAANGVILTDDLTDRFSVAYEELVPHISAANAMRWDNPSDVYPQPAYTYGSRASRLAKMLEAGHHGATLTPAEWRRMAAWIDTNGVYYDRYESAYPDRVIFNAPIRQALAEVTNRRCAPCHGKGGDGKYGTWWLSINRRDPGLSRALMAPLARSAGGWERCDGPVFAAKEDPDYLRLASELSALADRLRRTPREDLLALRGEEAERQQVVIPPPPPRRKAVIDAPDFAGAYLSDLPWLSASAGWSADGDGKPRRNRDVEDNALRLGTRAVRKGLGTHAPSEIAYRLDAAYARFTAFAACAEAGGSVVFRIYGDDKLLYDSGIARGLEPAKTIDIPIAGVRILRLSVTDAGDGINADMATWAEARVMK